MDKLKRVKPQFSICIPALESVADYDVTTGKFTGILSEPSNDILKIIMTAMNVTILPSIGQAELINDQTGQYSGCYGMLQRGETDIAGIPSVMPLIGIENVTQVKLATLTLEFGLVWTLVV